MEENNMPPYEKEEAFAIELDALITRFCREFNMTYAQMIGLLQIQAAGLIKEGFGGESQDDED